MSRLPAPGFSRLKAPGFSKPPSIAAASQVPLPAEESTDDEIFKKPQAPTQQQIPKAKPTSGLRAPKSNTLRPPSTSQSHGPSPYGRSKPQNSAIPYVGKKRTTGALKAPESRNVLAPKNNITNTTRNISSNQSIEKDTNERKTMGNSIPSKPVKRQLIPPVATSKSKLTQPRGTISRPSTSSGAVPRPQSSASTVQPRGISQPRKNSPMASKKTISRSLQSLPQTSQSNTSKGRLMKSPSVDTLNISKNASKPRSNLGKPKLNATSRLGKLGLIRPRASSHKPPDLMNNVISTPCQAGSNRQLNKLKISPIVNNNQSDTQESNTLEQSGLPNEASNQSVTSSNNTDSSFDVISNKSMIPLDQAGSDMSFNATYNKIDIPHPNRTLPVFKPPQENANSTKVISDVVNNNDTFSQDMNQTHVLSTHFSDVTQNLPLDESGDGGDCNRAKPTDSSLNCFNQTHVIPKTTQSVDLSLLSTTHTMNQDDGANDVFDETDFLANQLMPLCEETPQKTNVTLNESQENNSSFTDDILKVIAAISSNINTQPTSSVVMTTSPIKHSGPKTEHVMYHEVIQETNDHSETSEATTLKDATLDSSALQELELDTTAPKPKSNSFAQLSPTTTPVKGSDDNDNFFSIANRCYTVSAAELRRNKVSRRNTFQAHDASKFRVPKEMNMLETLEGNILMDNTSFLQLSNDTRAVKTMLLKLKRTLLEADCPSPLVKAPLKRSNSCSVGRTGDPPLLPRASQSSPMAVVDPFSPSSSESTTSITSTNENETEQDDKLNDTETTTTVSASSTTCDENLPDKTESTTSLTEKFQESLRRIEELEKESECHKYTIKLLQTQLETTEQKEQDMLEENIILNEEVNHLNERLQRILVQTGSRERNLSSSGSYKDEFDLADTESRRGILQRMYSHEAPSE